KNSVFSALYIKCANLAAKLAKTFDLSANSSPIFYIRLVKFYKYRACGIKTIQPGFQTENRAGNVH
ncbi:MAG: hypothetical protein K2H98_09505, partial [Duncaniella sp.]|nr:hypothetical protein [Duncaniella sp.]